MANLNLLLYVFAIVTLVTGQGTTQCEDVSTSACSLFLASNPAICSDPSIAKSCQRFCGLCSVTCYDCPVAVNSTSDCNTTKLCSSDEVCMTKTHTADDGGKEYILSCEKKATCDGLSLGFHTFVGKRASDIQRRDLSFECCSTDFCNYPSQFRTTPTPTTTTTVTPTTSTHIPYLPGCAKDIVFVLDGSSSIGQPNHAYMRDFVRSVISGLQISQSESQVAMVEYSDTARVEWYLNEHGSLREILAAANNIPYVTGSTATHAAFWLVRNSVLGPNHGARNNAKAVVVILTDGGTDIPALATSEAQLLHDAGVEIVAVGIGNNADTPQLRNLIHQNGNYYHVASFGSLRYIATSVKTTICK